jgi:hypothetical protein
VYVVFRQLGCEAKINIFFGFRVFAFRKCLVYAAAPIIKIENKKNTQIAKDGYFFCDRVLNYFHSGIEPPANSVVLVPPFKILAF